MAKKAVLKDNTIPAMFQLRAEHYGDRVCVKYKKEGFYTDISWNDLNEMVHQASYYLLAQGVKKGTEWHFLQKTV